MSGFGQLVPPHIELLELSQPPQPLEGHQAVEARIHRLEVRLWYWKDNWWGFSWHTVYFKLNSMFSYHHSHHVRNVIEACELIAADGEMPQSREAGNLLYLAQTVPMKVQYLEIQNIKDIVLLVHQIGFKIKPLCEPIILTVIWLRTLALATLSRILLSKLNNLGCGLSTGSMLRTSLSRMILSLLCSGDAGSSCF